MLDAFNPPPKAGPNLEDDEVGIVVSPKPRRAVLEDVDNLDAQYKQGAKRVRFQDRDFELQSVDDYIKLRNLILNDIAQQNGPQQIRQVRIYTRSGWGH